MAESADDRAAVKAATPPWAWAFAVACGIIPVLTLGGAIPVAIGLGGAAGCLAVARQQTMHVGARVGISAGVTFACWSAFGLLAVGVAMLQGSPGGAEAAVPPMRHSALLPADPSPPKRTRVTIRPGAAPIIEDLSGVPDPADADEVEPVEAVDPKNYLADLEPVVNEGLETRKGGFRRSATINGVEYEHAIWAQPRENFGSCRIGFQLDGRYGRLRGVAGMSDDTNRLKPGDKLTPAGVFRIHADGQLVWRSNNIVGAGAVEPVDLDVTGVDTIILSVETSTYSYMARTAWGDLELLE